MQNLHTETARHHGLATEAYRAASEDNEEGDNPSGKWHNQRALEFSDRTYELAKDANSDSGKIGTLENVNTL